MQHVRSIALKLCKPAYFELVLEPRNRKGCGRKGIWQIILWVAVVCVAAAGLLVVIQ